MKLLADLSKEFTYAKVWPCLVPLSPGDLSKVVIKIKSDEFITDFIHNF